MQPLRLPPQRTERPGEFSPGERRGSAAAHAAGLWVGVPLVFVCLYIGVPPGFAYIPSCAVAYLIARSFRRRRMAWGSFQGMQAAAIQLIITVLMIALMFAEPSSVRFTIMFLMAVLLFLYSLWGAWDTLFGDDFRYIGISRLLHRVSEANLQRLERRRGFGQPYRIQEIEKDDDPPRQP